MKRFAYTIPIVTALILAVPTAGFAQVRSSVNSRTIPVDALAVTNSAVTLDTTVRCTSGGKPVKCPAKIVVLSD